MPGLPGCLKGSAEYIPGDDEGRHEEYGEGEGFLKGRAGQFVPDGLSSEESGNAARDEEEGDFSRDDSTGEYLRGDARRAYENDDHKGRAYGAVDGHAAEEYEGRDYNESAADPEEAGEDAGDNADYNKDHGAARAHYQDAGRVALT